MERLPAEQWMQRCTAALRKQVQDEGVSLDDLAQCAAEMVVESRYCDLVPEAAAALWARDYA